MGLTPLDKEIELAKLRWVDLFSNRRLLEPIGYVPPVEYEQDYPSREQGQAVGGTGVN